MAKASEVQPIQFNRKNYFSFEFQIQKFLIGKDLWGHIFGTTTKPTDTPKKKISAR